MDTLPATCQRSRASDLTLACISRSLVCRFCKAYQHQPPERKILARLCALLVSRILSIISCWNRSMKITSRLNSWSQVSFKEAVDIFRWHGKLAAINSSLPWSALEKVFQVNLPCHPKIFELPMLADHLVRDETVGTLQRSLVGQDQILSYLISAPLRKISGAKLQSVAPAASNPTRAGYPTATY
jgi:hypothetical protein